MSNAPEEPSRPVDSTGLPSTESFLLGGAFAAEPLPAAAGPLERGASVGRYVILDRVGSGGMGVVYSAYDPELDRKVALKLLRPDRGASAGDPGRLRLLREAQAIARLSHPNVVAVYDAGSLGDQVFVVMEFVDGWTLRAWLAEKEPGWREVLDRFLLAGRGLAAAHAAGLVHRDFKPDNVLLGRDGRVRVVDFGLARPLGEAEEPDAEADRPGSPVGSGGLLASPLTQWGVALGTPSYMAPEQLRGEAADARSDQFSFCVSLYEALYRERPFAGDDPREVVAAVARGEVRNEPAKTRVPGRLRAALLRGLSADPERRFPSMEVLLHDLERDPAARRRRWLAAAVVVVATGTVFTSLGYFQARRARLCSGGEEKVASVWDATRKQAVRAAFLATGAPFAVPVWGSVEQSLDRYLGDWAGMRRQACEATRLRGEQSEDLLDRRMLCLDQRLQDVAALTDLFAHADRQVVDKAISAVNKLPGLDACADAAALTAKLPPPRDPEMRARVAAVQAELSQVAALTSAGKHAEALPRAQRAVRLARGSGYLPAEAAATFSAGHLQDLNNDSRGAEETLFEALVKAQAAGDPETAAKAASDLSWVVGYRLSRAAEGHRWFRLAEGLAEGAQGGEALRAELLDNLGAVLAGEQRFPEAIEVSQRALKLAERNPGRNQDRIAAITNNLGEFYNQLGRTDEALRYIRRSLEIRKRTLPPDHPSFIAPYNTLGNIDLSLGKHDEAAASFARSLEVARRNYGPDHWRTAGALYSLGIAQQNRGKLDEALRCYRQAMASFQVSSGPEHPYVAMSLASIAEALRLQEKPAESLAAYSRALAIQEKTLGKDHPSLAVSLVGISRDLVRLGRAAEAIPTSERALRLFEQQPSNPSFVAQSRFCVATALWEGGGDRARASRLARQARAELATAQQTPEQQEVETWLRERGLSW